MNPLSIPRRTANLALFAFFLALSVVGYGITFSFPSPFLPGYPGSAMFPRLVLIAMGLIAAIGMVRATFAGGAMAMRAPIEVPLSPFLAIVGTLVAFALVLLWLGSEIAVFAAIAGGLFFRTRRPLLSVLVGLAGVVVVYLLFVKVLSVHLPLLFLPRYWFMGS